MAYVITSPFGQQLFDALAPWQTDDLALYCDAIGVMFDPVLALVAEHGSDGDPGYVPTWGLLFDVDQCPTGQLGYLGNYVGVQIPVGASDSTARSLIRAEAGQSRGTPAALRAAIERSISTEWAPTTPLASGVLVTHGAPVVYYRTTTAFTTPATFNTTNLAPVDPATQYQLQERVNASGAADAYWVTIVVRPGQITPTGNTAALTAAVNDIKPAGIRLNIVVSNGFPWSGAVGAWNGAAAAGLTWAQTDNTNP